MNEPKTSRPFRERFLDGYDRSELQKEVRVAADKPNDVEFEIRYATFFGRVTRGGKPLHVRLFETATDPDTGDYTAALPALPKAGAVVTLVPCDGGCMRTRWT